MIMQHRIISDYVCDILTQRLIDHDINDIHKMLVNKIRRLNQGDNIALIINDEKCVDIVKLADFSDTFTIGDDDIVITYTELERLYYDHIQNAR